MTTPTPYVPSFGTPEARELPTLACIGTVASIEEPKETKAKEGKVQYCMQKIELEPLGAGRKTKVNFLFRPEWFNGTFNVKEFEEYDESDRKSLEFVFKNNVYPAKGGAPSVLQGIAGSNEDYGKLLGAITSPEPTMETVGNGLKSFVESRNGHKVGYVLKQRYDKTDELNEKGYPVKVATEFYEVGGWFDPKDEKALKSLKRRAAQDKLKITFDIVS